jgi:transcriptional regulator with XRE-family HTH domain
MIPEPQENPVSAAGIGSKLRSLRKGQGLSIRMLAEKAKLSPNTISLIESNSTSPTVATLQTIANVLGIPLGAFFNELENNDEVILLKVQDQEKQVAPGITISVVPDEVLGQCVHLMHFTIEAGVSSGEEPLVHPGDELVLCLQGELEYLVNERIYRLKRNDMLAFRSELPHSWVNRSQAKAVFLVLIKNDADDAFRSHLAPGED